MIRKQTGKLNVGALSNIGGQKQMKKKQNKFQQSEFAGNAILVKEN
jgi:hypothetical protein